MDLYQQLLASLSPELWIIVIAVLLGLTPAMIAYKKGRSPVLWWLFGTLLFVVALPAILIIDPKNVKKCPECAELVKEEAVKCRFCGHAFKGRPGEERRKDWTL